MRANDPTVRSKLLPKLLFGLILGIMVTVGFIMFADLKKVAETVREMPGHYVLLAFVLTFISYLLRLWKWHAFSRWSDFPIRFKDNAVIFFIGLMMSVTPGKAGELLKSYYLQQKASVSYAASIPVIFYDRLTDLLAMMVLVGIGLLVYPLGLTPLILLAAVIILFFIIIRQKGLLSRLIHGVTKPKTLQRFREPLFHFYRQTLSLLRWRVLSFAFVISVVAWFSECVSLYVIVAAFSADLSLLASIFTFSLGTIAGALSMIPGGLGAAEGSITGLLIYFGVGGSLAVTTSLLIRFVTLWFGVLIGFIVFLKNRKALLKT